MIFNSRVDAYSYQTRNKWDGPQLSGILFNDACGSTDWLLTVPLLLIEILLVMKLDEAVYQSKAWTLDWTLL